MKTLRIPQSGFTLVEIAIVLLIVTILLGYTVALFPIQQELKQYRAVNKEMDEIIASIIGFAQVNGRLPCPSSPDTAGLEDDGGTPPCDFFGGFVPVNTLGIGGGLNEDSLLLDPWGNPYRYYVSDSDFPPGGGNGVFDFVEAGEMRAVGLVDSDLDGYIDLDGNFLICDSAGSSTDDVCSGAVEVFGRDAGIIAQPGPYAGAPFVLVSHGKDWFETPTGDQLENMGASVTGGVGMPPNGPSGTAYRLKDVAGGQTTFVKRQGASEDFDDIVKWGSPNLLFSKMIEADQLP